MVKRSTATATEKRQTTRRRRSPEAARNEILDGATEFLRDHEWRELTIDNVMSMTTLSRPSFYVHFEDRVDLLLQLAGDVFGALGDRQERLDFLSVRQELYEPAHAAMKSLVEFYADNYAVLKALTAAAHHEPRVAKRMREIQERFIKDNTEWIAREIEQKRAPDGDPVLIASGLTLLTTNSLLRWLEPRTRPDLDAITETLIRIWAGAIWCTEPDRARAERDGR